MSLPDVPKLPDAGLYQFLLQLRKRVLDNTGTTIINNTTTGGGGGGGTATRDPPSFTLDFNGVPDGVTSNDIQIATAEADVRSTIRVPDGIFATSLGKSSFTKRYDGDGIWLLPAAALPANFGYAAVKPTTWPVQGEAGWFRGDQRFSDGGEWKVVGAGVRTYDTAARYYESNMIPHHAWFDVESGSSGASAYLTSGASAGATTITLSGAAEAEWIGHTCTLNSTFGGTQIETLTVQSVSGNTVTFTTPLTHSYVWNPAGGSAPCISFAPRTWNGYKYIRVRHRASGDGYGHIVRLQIEYNPKAAQLQHTFLAGTAGGYGGDINFISGSSGMYATAFEWAAYDQGNDVAHIAYVHSFTRLNDTAANGGRNWLGTRFQSAGSRPVDAAHVVGGNFRIGLDTALAFLKDTSYLSTTGSSGATTISVHSANGARAGDPIAITDGVNVYAGTISTVSGTTITITPGLNVTYGPNSFVEYSAGGAAVNMALGQKIVLNSTASNANRGGDPLGVFGPLYGNVQGDMEMGTTTDGTGDYWFVRYNGNGHGGATARLRLRPTVLQCNVEVQGNLAIKAGQELSTGGSSFSGRPTVVFGSAGAWLEYTTGPNRIRGTVDAGVTWTDLVV
jgi:hypothetical protein